MKRERLILKLGETFIGLWIIFEERNEFTH